jgi:hypothetical protein
MENGKSTLLQTHGDSSRFVCLMGPRSKHPERAQTLGPGGCQALRCSPENLEHGTASNPGNVERGEVGGSSPVRVVTPLAAAAKPIAASNSTPWGGYSYLVI